MSSPTSFRALLVALSLASCTAANPGLSPNPPTSAAPAWDGRADQSLRLEGGSECMGWLTRLGIAHQPLPPTKGMETPVRVTGPIGGIDYVSPGQPGLTADCRLVLALDWSSRVLSPLGVTGIRYSGAYVDRTQRSGRPSLHALGLAIDVHGVQFGQSTQWVESDYQRGGSTLCSPDAPALNRIECQLRQLGLFRELITPNHNSDHHDHLHLAIAPLN